MRKKVCWIQPGNREGLKMRIMTQTSGLQIKMFSKKASMHRVAMTRNWRLVRKQKNIIVVGMRASRGVKSSTPTIRCSIKTSSSCADTIGNDLLMGGRALCFLSLPNWMQTELEDADRRFCFLFSRANCPLSSFHVRLRHLTWRKNIRDMPVRMDQRLLQWDSYLCREKGWARQQGR